MLSIQKNKEIYFIILILVLFIFGLIFHLIPVTQKYILVITDITMLLTNSIVLYFVFKHQNDNTLLLWGILAFIITYFIELAGVRSGIVFGEYHYGNTMQIKLLNVPIVIGMNWVVLMLGSYSLALWTRLKLIFVPFLSSIMIVVFDFTMEKVAIKLDYWQWEENIVPFQNYIAWFFISLLFIGILALLKVNVENRILRVFFLVQFGFFVALRIFLL